MPDLYLGDDYGDLDDEMGADYYVGEEFDDDDDEVGADDELDEIFGDDEIIGALDEIIGARRRRRRRPRRRPTRRSRGMHKLQALALAKAAGGAATRPKQRTNVYEQPLPIPPTVFAASAQADIEIRPQRLFRTERLVVASDIAPFFRILDVKIGQHTLFVASGALPATIFSEVAVGVRLKGATANLGNTIVVSALNTDTANPHTFSGAIIGTVIE